MNQTYPSGMDPAAMDAATQGAATGAVLFMLLFYIPLIIFMTTSMMGVFIKADKPWWAAIVPIYNIIVILEVVGKPIWWIALMFIPIANVVVWILVAHSLSKSFGKDGAFTAGLVLLSFVFYPILAFGSAQYQGPAG